jgi:hypothetical protein
VRGVQPGDVGAQLADLGDQGLGLSHSTSISALAPMSTKSAVVPARRHRTAIAGSTSPGELPNPQ